MRQDQCTRVLRNHRLPSATSLYGGGQAYLFQQDNAHCNKAMKIMSFFERSNIEYRGPAVAGTEPELESHRASMGSPLQEGREKQAR